MKFYRLILIISGALGVVAALAHRFAGRAPLVIADLALVGSVALLYIVLRYPKRLIFQLCSMLTGVAALTVPVLAFDAAIQPMWPVWSFVGAWSSVALIGTVALAMLLGHWYLVVRGMPIDPLKRLTIAIMVATIVKIGVVGAVIASVGGGVERGTVLWTLFVGHGIFFWMRVGWGLLGSLVLWPMIWGTVRIRSTMAATGILYVALVAVVIGEVLGVWLSSMMNLPL